MHMLMNSTHLQTALINVVLIRARFLHISEKCSQLCLWECHIHTQILWKSWHALFASRTVNRLFFFFFNFNSLLHGARRQTVVATFVTTYNRDRTT